MRTFTVVVQPGHFAVCRLAADAPVPPPPAAGGGLLYSVTRTTAELSIVCAEDAVPAGALVEGGWRMLSLAGPFDLNTEVGVLVRILQPLADAGVGIFALSTYDTDHVLVHDAQLAQAVAALRAAGHTVT